MATDQTPSPPKTRGSGVRRAVVWVRRAFILLLTLTGLTLIGGALVMRHLERDLPDPAELKAYAPPQVTRILARDGTLLGEDYTERRTVVRLAEVPAVVKLAFLAAEDAHFYEHEGLNYLGMLRALWVNLRGGSRQGGSTITQQVIKNVLLTPEATLDRKLKEVILARKMEQELTKDEIFELYLNQIYFGHGRYGVEEASRYYFGKSVKDLSLAEAATLAGIPKGPSIYNPRDRPANATKRRSFVLSQMRDKGFARSEIVEEAKSTPIVLAPEPESIPELAPEIVAEARKVLKEVVGEAAAKGGYTIKTSIDPKLQAAARKAMQSDLDAVTARRGGIAPFKKAKKGAANKPFEGEPKGEGQSVYFAEVTAADDAKNEVAVRVGTTRGTIDLAKAARANPKKLPATQFAEPGAIVRVSIAQAGTLADGGGRTGAQFRLAMAPEGALVAIDPRTREVLAMVGGYEGVRAGLDRASRAKRQPGSTFKVFVYSYAIHDRSLTAASLIETDPAKIEGYKPKNYDKSVEHDKMRLRAALANSVNVSAVWTLNKVGPQKVVDWAKSLGLEDSAMQPTPSLALGAYEVTPRELTNAYASLAAGGVASEPRIVLEIVSPSGRQVALPTSAPPRRVMTPAEAVVTTSLLREVVLSGTGKAAQSLKRPVAGKTGTSNGGKDAWFAGYTTDIACAVWVGFDDGAPLGPGESGARAALPAWIEFMKVAHQGKPATDFPSAAGVVRAKVDPKTGLLARDDQKDAIDDVFLKETAPTETAPEDATSDETEGKTPEEIVDAEAKAEAEAKNETDKPSGGEREGKPAKKKRGKDDASPAAKLVGTEEGEARTELPPF